MNEIINLYQDVLTDGVTLVDRMPAIELTLARRLAYRLAVPSSPVENPTEYFRTTHIPVINKVISEFGESLPLNQVDVQKLTSALWQIRYELVHFPWNPLVDRVVAVCANEQESGERPYSFTQIPPRYSSVVSNDIYWHMDKRVSTVLDKLMNC